MRPPRRQRPYLSSVTSAPANNAPHRSDLEPRLDLARELGKRAEALALSYFQDPGLEVIRKPDGSPVTPADKAIEEMLRKEINAAFPGDAILGEEYGKTDGTSGFRWILDPIDGTRAFSRGIPTFGVLIAVEHSGRSVVGVSQYPGLSEQIYAAEGMGAFWEVPRRGVRPARVSNTEKVRAAFVEAAHPRAFGSAGHAKRFDSLAEAVSRIRVWSDAFALGLVATGRVDAGVHLGVSAWDIAPFDCILHEAGGRLTDWSGQRGLNNKSVLGTNGVLHDALIEVLAVPR